MVFWRTFENGFGAAWDAITAPNTLHAFKLTLIIAAIAVPFNTVFGILCALAIVAAALPGQGPPERVRRPAARALAGGRRPLAVRALRPRRLVRRLLRRPRDPDPLLPAGDRAGDDLRLGAVRRARGRADAARDRRRAGAGRAHARRVGLADVLADHAAVDPLGGDLRRRPDDGALPRRVRRGRGRVRPPGGARPRPRRSASRTSTRTSTCRAPTPSRSCSRYGGRRARDDDA